MTLSVSAWDTSQWAKVRSAYGSPGEGQGWSHITGKYNGTCITQEEKDGMDSKLCKTAICLKNEEKRIVR